MVWLTSLAWSATRGSLFSVLHGPLTFCLGFFGTVVLASISELLTTCFALAFRSLRLVLSYEVINTGSFAIYERNLFRRGAELRLQTGVMDACILHAAGRWLLAVGCWPLVADL